MDERSIVNKIIIALHYGLLLMACKTLNYYLNQSWSIAYGTIRKKFKSNLNENMKSLIHEKCISICNLWKSTTFFDVKEYFGILLQISLKINPISNEPALLRATAWCRLGDKPLLELMMTQFNDVHKQWQASWVKLSKLAFDRRDCNVSHCVIDLPGSDKITHIQT